MVKKRANRFSGKGKTNKRGKSMERVKIDFEEQVKRVKKRQRRTFGVKTREERKKK